MFQGNRLQSFCLVHYKILVKTSLIKLPANECFLLMPEARYREWPSWNFVLPPNRLIVKWRFLLFCLSLMTYFHRVMPTRFRETILCRSLTQFLSFF